MCYTSEIVTQITEDVEKAIGPDEDRCGIFVQRLEALQRSCLICQHKKTLEDAKTQENRVMTESIFYRECTNKIRAPKAPDSTLTSSTTPPPSSPPHLHPELSHYTPYPAPAPRLSLQPQTPFIESLSPQPTPHTSNPLPPWSPTPRQDSCQPSYGPASPASNTAKSDPALKSLAERESNQWLQMIDNPSASTSRVAATPSLGPPTTLA